MPRRSNGEEEKDRSGARDTRPTAPEDEGVERPIWKEPRPTEREEEQDPKAELGGNDDSDWLKDPNAESANVDVGPMRPTGPADTAGLDVGPVTQESGDVDEKIGAMPLPSPMPAPDEGDPAGFTVGPIGREGSGDEEVDPAGIKVPDFKEGADEGDPAAVVWPQYKEGPESIDAETEDDDWAEGPEMEADIDMDVEDEEEHAT